MSSSNIKRSLTSLRSEVVYREAIRPFICSTFEDFAQEREYLSDNIFPRLATACYERGTQFFPVDLRWNEESYKSNSSLVLCQCFEAIEDCAPYFICLLGERYGVHRPQDISSDEAKETSEWLRKNYETAAACAGNEWLLDDENKHCSITELEIIKASFRERTKYGYYYFRDPENVRRQSVGQDISQKARLMEIYESENEFAAKKMKELKQQIIDTDLPVKYFKTVEELGNHVLKDWFAVLNSLHPPLDKSVFHTSSSEDFRQWSIHETFAETRRKNFVVTQTVRLTRDILSRHAQYADGTKSRSSATSMTKMSEGSFLTSLPEMENFPSIIALVGERGGGLTAIIANWVKKFRVENPRAVIISHYTESGQAAGTITSFMRRCSRQLREEFCQCDITDYNDFLAINDYSSTVEAFQASLLLGPSVVILDGLSHLSSCYDIPAHVIKELTWLPSNMPPSCRIIVSTTRSDITCKHLQARNDVHMIEIPTMKNDEKSRILHEWLGKHASYLDARDEASIHAGKLSGVPLFHVALANEIRLHGRAGISEKQLEAYTHARNFSDFWTAVIRRWSHDYSWLKPAQIKNGVPMKTQVSKDRLNNGWIPDALRLISVSRDGLTSDELTKILRAFGYNRKHGISRASWRMFISAAKNTIYVRSDGLLSFQQASLREAVDFLLLNGLTSPSHVRHVTPFEISWEVQKFQYHSVLVNSFAVFPCDQRLVNELPWQRKVAGDVIGLCETLGRPDVFVTMWSREQNMNARYDFINYWKHLTGSEFDPVETYCTMVAEAEKDMVTGVVRDTMGADDATGCLPIAERIVKKSGDKFYSTEVSYLAFLVGTYFLGVLNLVSAELMLLKAFKLARDVTSVNDVDYLCKVQSSLGDLYYEGKLMEKAVVFYRGVLNTAHQVTTCVNMEKVELLALQAIAYKRMAEITVRQMLISSRTTFASEKSLGEKMEGNETNSLVLAPQAQVRDMMNEATRLTELSNLDDGKASIDHIMGLLTFCEKQFDESDMLLNRAINTVEELYGPSHLIIAIILQDLAKYYRPSECEITDITRREKLYRRALKIRENKLGKSHLDVSETLVELGCILQAKRTRDSLEEARYMLQRAVDIRTEQLGVYHDSTKEARRTLMKFQ